MKMYSVYGKVVGSKYLGYVEAETEGQARELAENLNSLHVSLCHSCSHQINDPEITEIDVEEKT